MVLARRCVDPMATDRVGRIRVVIDPVASDVVAVGPVVVTIDGPGIATHHRSSVVVSSRLRILHDDSPDVGQSPWNLNVDAKQRRLVGALLHAALDGSSPDQDLRSMN